MPIPRILFGVPLLVAGIFLPALGPDIPAAPAGTIGMSQEVFTTEHVKIHQGETLTLVNNSRFVHIIGEGKGGRLFDASTAPVQNRKLMETNDIYTSGKWTTPGTYYLTCIVHPEMTVEVVVDRCDCCSTGTCA